MSATRLKLDVFTARRMLADFRHDAPYLGDPDPGVQAFIDYTMSYLSDDEGEACAYAVLDMLVMGRLK